jgi:DNA-directed RNA polymerase subunit K/omega
MRVEQRDRDIMKAVEKAGSTALFINMVTRRISQLHRGAKPLMEHAEGRSAVDIAIIEFNEGRIGFRRRPEN